jgi:hypothetical protein
MLLTIYINKIQTETEQALMHTLEINSNLELQDHLKIHLSSWPQLLQLLQIKLTRLKPDLKMEKNLTALWQIFMLKLKISDSMVTDIVNNGQYKHKSVVFM